MKTVEEFFSTFKKEGNTWPKGLLVRLRHGGFTKVFSVIPEASYGCTDDDSVIHKAVIGKVYGSMMPMMWGLDGSYWADPEEFDDDYNNPQEHNFAYGIVEIYSGELIAKTEDKDEQAPD
jgi:hypothetical protein